MEYAYIIAIIVVVVYYYIRSKQTSAPSSLLNSKVYTTGGKGDDSATNIPMITPEEANTFLTENFTLSYYITITNLGGGTPDKNGQAMAPLIWIQGVGALVVDMISGNVYMIITSAPYDPTNPVPSTQIILLNGTNAGLFVNKWNQVTLTIGGSNACVYLNGNMIGNCISLANVSYTSPSGVYFLKGQGPAAVISSLQIFPTVLSSANIAINYKQTSDTSRSPINYEKADVTLSDIQNTIISLFCQTGLCPSNGSDDVTFGPFIKINYEYS